MWIYRTFTEEISSSKKKLFHIPICSTHKEDNTTFMQYSGRTWAYNSPVESRKVFSHEPAD